MCQGCIYPGPNVFETGIEILATLTLSFSITLLRQLLIAASCSASCSRLAGGTRPFTIWLHVSQRHDCCETAMQVSSGFSWYRNMSQSKVSCHMSFADFWLSGSARACWDIACRLLNSWNLPHLSITCSRHHLLQDHPAMLSCTGMAINCSAPS